VLYRPSKRRTPRVSAFVDFVIALLNEIESEVQGIVREVLVGNAEPVEYGQVLFRIEPTA